MKMIIRKLTTKELEEWGLFHTAWKRINDILTHDIWLEMNPDNYSAYLNIFDYYLIDKWERYARLN